MKYFGKSNVNNYGNSFTNSEIIPLKVKCVKYNIKITNVIVHKMK